MLDAPPAPTPRLTSRRSNTTSAKPRQAYGSQPRRSSRQIEAAKPKEPLLNLAIRILVYPSIGPGAVNITNADLSRLEPQQFLNDTLIELWLKCVFSRSFLCTQCLTNLSRFMMRELREKNPTLADEVHVFSSFFYKKLDPKK